MALPLFNSSEGGTDTTAISTGNSGGASGNAYDLVSGASPVTFSATHPAHGGMGMALQGVGRVQWSTASVGTPTTIWGRTYVYFTVVPTVATGIASGLTPTSTTLGQFFVRIATSGKLTNAVKTGTSVSSTTTLAINTLYRIEYKFVTVASGTCTLDCTIYLGDSVSATETMTQATATGASTDTSINGVFFGPINATPANTVYYDDLQINGTGFPGPYLRSLPTRGVVGMNQAVNRASTY